MIRRLRIMGIGKKLRSQFIAGIIVTVPIGITIWLVIWVFTGIDSILQPAVSPLLGRTIPGLGFAILIVLVYLVGVLATSFGTRRLIVYGQSFLNRIPIVRPIYSTTKQIMDSFSASGKAGFKQVVVTEFPMKGIRTIGFVTNESLDKVGNKLLYIFIPTAPNPTSGFLQIVNAKDVIQIDTPVDDALKMVVSAGGVLPSKISDKLAVL
jgi:uncharacterized membrane protein